MCNCPSKRDGVLRSGMLLHLHHIYVKIVSHPAKFDKFKDETISDYITVSVFTEQNTCWTENWWSSGIIERTAHIIFFSDLFYFLLIFLFMKPLSEVARGRLVI